MRARAVGFFGALSLALIGSGALAADPGPTPEDPANAGAGVRAGAHAARAGVSAASQRMTGTSAAPGPAPAAPVVDPAHARLPRPVGAPARSSTLPAPARPPAGGASQLPRAASGAHHAVPAAVVADDAALTGAKALRPLAAFGDDALRGLLRLLGVGAVVAGAGGAGVAASRRRRKKRDRTD